MANIPRPANISEEVWQQLTPASRRILAVERICARCGADHQTAPDTPGECYLNARYFCPTCGPATWEQVRQQAAACTSEPPAKATRAAAAPPAPVATSNGGRQLPLEFPA